MSRGRPKGSKNGIKKLSVWATISVIDQDGELVSSKSFKMI